MVLIVNMQMTEASEAETRLAFGRSMEAANLPAF